MHEDDDGELTYTDREYSDDEEEQIEESFREGRERRREGLDKEQLGGLGPELQEALIVEDLLFVLMVRIYTIASLVSAHPDTAQGIEGQYVEYDPLYNPEDELERLQGAQFVIDPQLGAPVHWLLFEIQLTLDLRRPLARERRGALHSHRDLLHLDSVICRAVLGSQPGSH